MYFDSEKSAEIQKIDNGYVVKFEEEVPHKTKPDETDTKYHCQYAQDLDSAMEIVKEVMSK